MALRSVKIACFKAEPTVSQICFWSGHFFLGRVFLLLPLNPSRINTISNYSSYTITRHRLEVASGDSQSNLLFKTVRLKVALHSWDFFHSSKAAHLCWFQLTSSSVLIVLSLSRSWKRSRLLVPMGCSSSNLQSATNCGLSKCSRVSSSSKSLEKRTISWVLGLWPVWRIFH